MQALPQLVPKTEVEFKANLGSVVSKSIELKNPSSKAIKYDVTLEGSTDFRTKGTEVGAIHSVACVARYNLSPKRAVSYISPDQMICLAHNDPWNGKGMHWSTFGSVLAKGGGGSCSQRNSPCSSKMLLC